MECTEPSYDLPDAKGLSINETQDGSRAPTIGRTNVEEKKVENTDKSNNSLGNLSNSQLAKLDALAEQMLKGEVDLNTDKNGQIVMVYKDQPVLHWDSSNANKVYVPQKGESKEKRQDMIGAFLEQLKFIKNHKYNAGIVVDPSKVKHTRQQIFPGKTGLYEEGVHFEKTTKILGTGGIAGQVLVVKDKDTGAKMAKKTVAVCTFRNEELRCWLDLNDTGYPPCLYVFQIKGGNMEIYMEPIENAVTLNDIIENHWLEDEKMRRTFSLFMFDGLLTAVQTMNDRGWTHGDLHSGNIMVDHLMKIKILDFGQAKQLDAAGGLSNFRQDLEEVVRKFTKLYLDDHFDSVGDIRKDTRQQRLNQAADYLQISPEDRQEIFTLIDNALKIVAPSEVTNFQKDLRKMLPSQKEMDNIMKEVIAILFADQYQNLHPQAPDGALSSMDGIFSEMEDRTGADSVEEVSHLKPVTDDVLEMFRQNVRIG